MGGRQVSIGGSALQPHGATPKWKNPGWRPGLSKSALKGGSDHMVAIVQSMVGYVAPKGYRIAASRSLENGLVEVQLEPIGLIG